MNGWRAASFLIAFQDGPERRAGYAQNGLGLWVQRQGTRHSKPIWCLSHIGTGHLVARFSGYADYVFPIASDISALGDWTFLGLDGYKNRMPDLKERLQEVLLKHKIRDRMTGSIGQQESVALTISRTL